MPNNDMKFVIYAYRAQFNGLRMSGAGLLCEMLTSALGTVPSTHTHTQKTAAAKPNRIFT